MSFTVIEAGPELREGELITVASLRTAFAGALRQRGTAPAITSPDSGRPLRPTSQCLDWPSSADPTEPGNAELVEVIWATLAYLAGLTAS
ncbi:MAG TPA: hypothetical protein VGH89_14485 [Pseudonocardia sp.]|jgi:hypothetical protein